MSSIKATFAEPNQVGKFLTAASSEVGFLTSAFWGVAELLRGDFKSSEYQDVILPLIFLLRTERTSAEKKSPRKKVRSKVESRNSGSKKKIPGAVRFVDICELGLGLPEKNIERELEHAVLKYLSQLEVSQRALIESIDFKSIVNRLREAELLHIVLTRIASVSDSVLKLSNQLAGELYESLLNRFAEFEGEEAGEHFTPPEIIELMAQLLYTPSQEKIRKSISLYDPACGIGGMLEIAASVLTDLTGRSVEVFGQELNPRTHALAEIIRTSGRGFSGQIMSGNTLVSDAFSENSFELMIANPPFGVDWKKAERQIRREARELGDDGRFGAGLPRVSDGSLLFLQHLISKMRSSEGGGSRIAILFSGSPLFSGTAGSGESRIRHWILANDLLEGVVALPDSIFLNTTVSTYVWVLTNKKQEQRKGKIRLVDARHRYSRLSRNIGSRRNQITESDLVGITEEYLSSKNLETSRDISLDDCFSIRISVQFTFADGSIETENVLIPCPKNVTATELLEDDLSGTRVRRHVDSYLKKNYNSHGVNAVADFKRCKIFCGVPFKSFFCVQKNEVEPESLTQLIGELSSAIQVFERQG
jgi:type I restriction enzyme M protein